MPYAIMRLEKRKIGSVTSVGKHHERLKEEYRSNPDIDLERTQYNYHLIEPDDSYRKMTLKRIEEAGAKRRKDSVVLVDGLVAATPEWLLSFPIEKQKEYFDYTFDFIKERYGEENIISAVVHLDEATPHMHFCFVPITEDNRLSAKDIIGGPSGLVKLQNEFYEHVHERYPDIERGMSKQVTKREHVPMEVFKAADRLYSHYNEIAAAVQGIGLFRNQPQKDAALNLLAKYAPEMVKIKEQVKSTEDHINDLEKTVESKSNRIGSLERQNRDQGRQIDDLQWKVTSKDRKIKNLQNEIGDLMELIEQIPDWVLERAEAKLQDRYNDYER